MTTLMKNAARVFAGIAFTIAVSFPVDAAKKEIIETFTATMVSVGGSTGGRSTPVTIRVYRYATEDDFTQLSSAFADGGSQALLKVLQKIEPMGSFQVDGRVSYDVGAVFNIPVEGGRKIVIVTERPISFRENRNMSRSTDYPFGTVQINVNDAGKGDGSVIPAAKIYIDKKGQTVVENFQIYAFKLMGVRARS